MCPGAVPQLESQHSAREAKGRRRTAKQEGLVDPNAESEGGLRKGDGSTGRKIRAHPGIVPVSIWVAGLVSISPAL